MRMLFTVLGLLLTVAIVGLLVKQQMSALKPTPATPVAATAGQTEGAAPANQVQQVRDDVQKALAQGAAAQAAAASAAANQ